MKRLLTILGFAVVVGAVTVFINLSYVGAGDPGAQVYSMVDKNSLAGLNSYRAGVDQKIERIMTVTAGAPNKKVRATVTFSRPLSIAERDTLIKDHGIEPDAYQATAIDLNMLGSTSVTVEQLKNDYMKVMPALEPRIPGGIITFGIPPKFTMNEINESLAGNSYNEELIGFINMRAFIPAKNLVALNNDSRVFLADVTLDESIAANPKGKWMPDLFGDLARLGYQGK